MPSGVLYAKWARTKESSVGCGEWNDAIPSRHKSVIRSQRNQYTYTEWGRKRWMDWKPVRLVCQPIRLCSIALEHWIRFRIEIARENNNYFHFNHHYNRSLWRAIPNYSLSKESHLHLCTTHTHTHTHSFTQSVQQQRKDDGDDQKNEEKVVAAEVERKNTNERTTTQEHIAYTLWIDALIGSATSKRNGIFAN